MVTVGVKGLKQPVCLPYPVQRFIILERLQGRSRSRDS